jgi:hypothetical protein
MEVHAHTHTARKKWTHYFWEFLMLFLAVFCGFLAEYQLEHKIEKDREKQYIRSLVNDIKGDIDQLEDLDLEWQVSFTAADSLLIWLKGKEILTNSSPAFNLISWAIGFGDFVSNDGTLQQLKNSGGLRLLRVHGIADSIMVYQRSVNRINIKQQGMNDAQHNSNRVSCLFNAIAILDVDAKNIPLLKTDKGSINDAYLYILGWRSEFRMLRELGSDTKECGMRLLKFIKEQYGIN